MVDTVVFLSPYFRDFSISFEFCFSMVDVLTGVNRHIKLGLVCVLEIFQLCCFFFFFSDCAEFAISAVGKQKI